MARTLTSRPCLCCGDIDSKRFFLFSLNSVVCFFVTILLLCQQGRERKKQNKTKQKRLRRPNTPLKKKNTNEMIKEIKQNIVKHSKKYILYLK